MIPILDAFKRIVELVGPLAPVEVDIDGLAGLVAAENITSPLDLPPFDRSTMDGYAVRAEDTRQGVTLDVKGVIPAGKAADGELKPGEAWKIMTGAPVIKGADAVVKIEDTDGGKDKVKINEKVEKGNFINPSGSVVRKNEILIRNGTRIRSVQIPLLASCNISKISVYPKPTVSVISTGDEIVPVGSPSSIDKIPDANSHTLKTLLSIDGIDARFLGIAGDNPDSVREIVKKGLESDILIISGGVSMGDFDYVGKVLKEEGVLPVFERVKLKPGKPTFFGTLGSKAVFGLPGNPVSVYVTYSIFARAAIWKMAGRTELTLTMDRAILQGSGMKGIERTQFVPARLFQSLGRSFTSFHPFIGSADVRSLAKADCFIVVPESPGGVQPGEQVQILGIKR